MAEIKFKTKIRESYYSDRTLAARYFDRPLVFSRKHCDMEAFRKHKELGGLANSVLFAVALNRILLARGIGKRIYLQKGNDVCPLPEGIRMTEGYLTTVQIEV